MSKSWRLPNGEYTSNANKMIRTWKRLYTPIEKGLGLQVVAFDPGIRFRDKEQWNGSFDLTISQAERVRSLILENRKLKKALKIRSDK